MDATIFVFSLSAMAQKVNSYYVKTIPEDQEYAEYYFLHPNEKAADPKTCLRKDLRNKTNICDIDVDDFWKICKEAVEVECIRSLYTSHYLDYDQIPQPCKNYTVKLYRSNTTEVVHRRLARECPTIIGGHPLWVSQGNEIGGIFVYSENFISGEKLRVEDYILFIDTEHDSSS